VIVGEAGVVFDAAVLALELVEAELEGDDLREAAVGTFDRLRAGPWIERARGRMVRPVRET
jgi:hypothetical protein